METIIANRAKIAADESIRPFQCHFPQAVLDDLRHRIESTRWSEKEPVDNFSQGAPLEKGRHFFAWEQPALFVNEMRVAFSSLRKNIIRQFKH
jgi:hypothetical protein